MLLVDTIEEVVSCLSAVGFVNSRLTLTTTSYILVYTSRHAWRSFTRHIGTAKAFGVGGRTRP